MVRGWYFEDLKRVRSFKALCVIKEARGYSQGNAETLGELDAGE